MRVKYKVYNEKLKQRKQISFRMSFSERTPCLTMVRTDSLIPRLSSERVPKDTLSYADSTNLFPREEEKSALDKENDWRGLKRLL